MGVTNLEPYRAILETRAGMFGMGACTLVGGYYLKPAPDGLPDPRFISLAREAVDRATNGRPSLAPQIATALKREGDLQTADAMYGAIHMAEDVYDKEHVWPWIKVYLLDKNFEEADYLLYYLYMFNVAVNNFRLEAGDDFSDYRDCGKKPPLNMLDFRSGEYLRQISNRYLATRQEVESAIAAYGGSDYWQQNFYLSESDYRAFCRVFR